MLIAFRADASLQIGTGHIMRCLALAKAMRDHHMRCIFVCRELEGNLIEKIRQENFECKVLRRPLGKYKGQDSNELRLKHAEWLETSWRIDAEDVVKALGELDVDWLVVDHYALDARWHDTLRSHARKILVIDDLADRQLDCDVLLDQNLGRETAKYGALIPKKAISLIGPKYALLRSEFSVLMHQSRSRVREFPPRSYLVNMGGIDVQNNVSDVLRALAAVNLPEDSRVTVVVGGNAPHLAVLRSFIPKLPFVTNLQTDVANMAELMLEVDLAITASGLIIYELACMDVPTLLLPVSDVQLEIARLVSLNMCADIVEDWKTAPALKIKSGLQNFATSSSLSRQATINIDGLGCQRVVDIIRGARYV